MKTEVLEAVRKSAPCFKNSILRSVTLFKSENTVKTEIVCDCVFSESDRVCALKAIRKFVPAAFECEVEILKLTPDCKMVRDKIISIISDNFKAVFATLGEDDVNVRATDGGFEYTVALMSYMQNIENFCDTITSKLENYFCGSFRGSVIASGKSAEDIVVDDKPDEVEFEVPIRTFKIRDFEFLEGKEKRDSAVYIADLNFAGDEVVICGTIEDIRERKYTNKQGVEKTYLSIVIGDTTATTIITYFIRQKSRDRIKNLKIGDSIVCFGKNEAYKGNLRYTANIIDFGKIPEHFVPEKKQSKPVPGYYRKVMPQVFNDIEQTDLFSQEFLPKCLTENTFVVFDLETTGLNSSPVSGNMDSIIEIGAYKIIGGAIKESFSTFVNPGKRLSEEIVNLTGITEQMLQGAPTYEEAMPDFYKFANGSILVGHNIAGFDFKFVDYYCARLGYILDRKIIDTIPLSQELLFLSNYKLNTIADKFNISFNHHRATDDALATAKIFIELIKLKKSLPKLQ